MPYALLARISEGRQTFKGRSITVTGLNVCVDTSIGSSSGRLVPLESVGSPVVAMCKGVWSNSMESTSVFTFGNQGKSRLVSNDPLSGSKGILVYSTLLFTNRRM